MVSALKVSSYMHTLLSSPAQLPHLKCLFVCQQMVVDGMRAEVLSLKGQHQGGLLVRRQLLRLSGGHCYRY
jgi:hypothetical protein